MSNLRNGSFGFYYGSLLFESGILSQSEMETNARYIYKYFEDKGWSLNSICAILGNMQAESSINPGRWQNDDVANNSLGYGLVQWTPSTKYINWAYDNGYLDPSEMDNNLARIVYEVENNLQWIATDSYNITFTEFAMGRSSVIGDELPVIYSLETLTESFLINYERPADQSDSVKAYRTSLATNWYNFLVDLPDTPAHNKYNRKKYKFLLLNARKRRNEWIKTQ